MTTDIWKGITYHYLLKKSKSKPHYKILPVFSKMVVSKKTRAKQSYWEWERRNTDQWECTLGQSLWKTAESSPNAKPRITICTTKRSPLQISTHKNHANIQYRQTLLKVKYSMINKTEIRWSWGDGSVDKALAAQVNRPEFWTPATT